MEKTQVILRKGRATTVAWIDSKAAKVGNRVELLPEKELWDVAFTGSTTNQDQSRKFKDFQSGTGNKGIDE